MNPRSAAIREAIERKPLYGEAHRKTPIDKFGHFTFNLNIMERMLPKDVCANIFKAMKGKDKINPDFADPIAQAMKDWAVAMGATHFCHWFQPLTGFAAEKHEAFIDWKTSEVLIEKFSGKQLLQGEPDASSFPSGGLRSTFEARGYTAWDPSSIPFLWRSGGATVLCVPSIFFSWSGKALDMKIPLLRSDAKISEATMRLLNLLKITANSVYSTLGCEQEYFLLDRALFSLRPDLLMAGRTVYGVSPSKTQELEDNYFGVIKERVLAFMRDFEEVAFDLGIPLKSRHNEVAPGQYEVAPIYEKASIAVDHNILTMELMRQVAARHNLVCLLHEKPFAGINGSGKHNNWSLCTDSGMNLLNPSYSSENGVVFLILLTAVLNGIFENGALLRASIASAGNDHRLGGHEAPPVIMSVYLGEALEKMLTEIEENGSHEGFNLEKFDLKVQSLPDLPKDNSDRNRTSPFAFTGNKFEFRAVGASANCAFPLTVINSIVAASLNRIMNEIEAAIEKPSNLSLNELQQAILPIVRKFLKASRPIRYSGDNYSVQWKDEARKRNLPIIDRSLHAFKMFIDPSAGKILDGVLSEEELQSRFNIMVDRYCKEVDIEAKLMSDIFYTQILPVAIEHQKQFAKSLKLLHETEMVVGKAQSSLLKKLCLSIDKALDSVASLEEERHRAKELKGTERGEAFCEKVVPKCEQARVAVDALEMLVDDRLWPLPKYRELLWIL